MGGLKSSMVVFMVMVFASMQLQTSMAQTRHVVGDSLGWTINSNGAAAYTTWAAQQTFAVGDSLVFNFTTGMHNVAEVPQTAFGPCTAGNPISISTTGPATVTLTTPGAHYYICTVGTHCQFGQKLAINVSAPATAPTTPPPAAAPTTPPPAATPTPAPVSPPTPAPAPSTTTPPPSSSPAPSPVEASPPSPPPSSPSPSGSTTPSPAGSTTPSPAGSTTPPPPSNSVQSFSAVVPATLLAVGLALFY